MLFLRVQSIQIVSYGEVEALSSMLNVDFRSYFWNNCSWICKRGNLKYLKTHYPKEFVTTPMCTDREFIQADSIALYLNLVIWRGWAWQTFSLLHYGNKIYATGLSKTFLQVHPLNPIFWTHRELSNHTWLAGGGGIEGLQNIWIPTSFVEVAKDRRKVQFRSLP